ncbi:MAG TPA: DUF4331 family protein [Pyrinomonadaceae bacterium]|nr:DUF4331 family protein [Pyrinomonadaceae bacterium]
MFLSRIRKNAILVAGLIIAIVGALSPMPLTNAADHAESTSVAGDPGADLADVFAFLDPSDNSKVVLALDVEGFVVPSELLNLSFFAPEVTYRLEIENTGDAAPDQTIDITFSAQTSRSQPQTATIRLPNGRVFTAPTTLQTVNSSPNPFVVTTDSASGAKFFAGLTDDPFYFDIVGFNRFVASVLSGSPDPTTLQRGRDSFAGYNIHMIALEVPAAMLRGSAGNIIGVNGVTLRSKQTHRSDGGGERTNGPLIQVDRMATPAVNTALIPFPRKNEYNAATPVDDAAGRFAGSIVGTLQALGTNQTNIGILANVAVVHGDYLRLDLSVPNTSVGFGERITTPGYTGFPNGRRPGDDTIDDLLFFIANQTPIGDNVNSNDVPLGSTFPFFAPPQQPRAAGVIDDNTRN